MGLTYRSIRAQDLDAGLVEAWRAIQAGDRTFESPYFCPEFTQAVGSVRTDVRVVVIENGGRPVGFFPYQRSSFGVGRPVGGSLSDYHGVIAGPGAAWELDALMRAAGLSVWPFNHLVGGVPQFEPYVASRATSPQMELNTGYAQYVQERRKAGSDYIRRNETKARKLGREVGELTFAFHEPGGGVLERLISWKSQQYRRGNLVDVFGAPWAGELLRKIAGMQTGGFAGVCSVLRAGDRIVAAHMGMRSRDVLHYWFPSYDPDYSKYSAGIILVLRMAEAMAGAGVRTLDFGKGDMEYKLNLMTRAVELREGAVELPSLATAARRARRDLEAWVRRSPLLGIARIPGRLLTKLERRSRLR